jgi:hypothetical protein
MWLLAGGPGGSITGDLRFEFAGFAPSNAFGVWSGVDTQSISLLQIFGGADDPGAFGTIHWITPTSGVLTVTHADFTCTTIPFSGIAQNGFGFYLQGPGTGYGQFFTVDQLNGGLAQSLAFVNPVNDRWVIAFEDLKLGNGADGDYNDMVVSVESIQPVPEPASIVLFGTGLLGVAGAIRRKLSR